MKLVGTSDKGLAWPRKQLVDLVLLDGVMDPGLGGLDTYRQILTLHAEKSSIMARGLPQTARARTAIELGMRPFIDKPHTISGKNQRPWRPPVNAGIGPTLKSPALGRRKDDATPLHFRNR